MKSSWKCSLVACLLALWAPLNAAPDQPTIISLWNHHSPDGSGGITAEDARLLVMSSGTPNSPALVICPGGAYGMKVMNEEGLGIAKWLNQHGITGIVLDYRLPKGRSDVPLLDAQRAMREIRSKAQELQIDPKRLGIIGFSAGGHLASTLCTHFDLGNPQATDVIEQQSCRPDFGLLIYPVITMGPQGHAGSRKNLLGAQPSPELITKFSNESQITAQTPPCFLAHALDDKIVPIANSRMFAEALKKAGVSCQLLELPNGGHGFNHYHGPSWDAWQKDSLEWLQKNQFIP